MSITKPTNRARLLQHVLVGGLSLALLPAAGRAAPIRYEFGGMVDTAEATTGVAPGTRFSGYFLYDPAARPTGRIEIEGSIQYQFGRMLSAPDVAADGAGLMVLVGDRVVLPDPAGVEVAVSELEYPGQYGYRDQDGQPAGPSTTVSISNHNLGEAALDVALVLKNPTRSLFGSLAPPSTLSLADFPLASLHVSERTNPGTRILFTGSLDTLEAVATPEPSTLAVFAILALTALRYRGWLAGRAGSRLNPRAAKSGTSRTVRIMTREQAIGAEIRLPVGMAQIPRVHW